MAIFKNGDDLRQDILTLQMIEIMDRIWLDNDLDLAMTPYKVLTTDCEQGFMEFNANAATLAEIQYEYSLINTFSDTTIMNWFKKHIKNDIEKNKETAGLRDKEKHYLFKEKLQKIRDVFIRSTAGYCVASYVLGLGDRHPDNIMINYKEGNLIHIDFGHFLENKKTITQLGSTVKKLGILRERDPFVFTGEIAYFVNGRAFKKNQNTKDDDVVLVSASTRQNTPETSRNVTE